MTTIAVRNGDGAITMTADSQFSGNSAYGDPVRKSIHGDGFLLGLPGPVAVLQQIEHCMQVEVTRYPLTA